MIVSAAVVPMPGAGSLALDSRTCLVGTASPVSGNGEYELVLAREPDFFFRIWTTIMTTTTHNSTATTTEMPAMPAFDRAAFGFFPGAALVRGVAVDMHRKVVGCFPLGRFSHSASETEPVIHIRGRPCTAQP